MVEKTVSIDTTKNEESNILVYRFDERFYL